MQNNLEKARFKWVASIERVERGVSERMTRKAVNEINICTQVLGPFGLESNLMLHSNLVEWKDVKPS